MRILPVTHFELNRLLVPLFLELDIEDTVSQLQREGMTAGGWHCICIPDRVLELLLDTRTADVVPAAKLGQAKCPRWPPPARVAFFYNTL